MRNERENLREEEKERGRTSQVKSCSFVIKNNTSGEIQTDAPIFKNLVVFEQRASGIVISNMHLHSFLRDLSSLLEN